MIICGKWFREPGDPGEPGDPDCQYLSPPRTRLRPFGIRPFANRFKVGHNCWSNWSLIVRSWVSWTSSTASSLKWIKCFLKTNCLRSPLGHLASDREATKIFICHGIIQNTTDAVPLPSYATNVVELSAEIKRRNSLQPTWMSVDVCGCVEHAIATSNCYVCRK